MVGTAMATPGCSWRVGLLGPIENYKCNLQVKDLLIGAPKPAVSKGADSPCPDVSWSAAPAIDDVIPGAVDGAALQVLRLAVEAPEPGQDFLLNPIIHVSVCRRGQMGDGSQELSTQAVRAWREPQHSLPDPRHYPAPRHYLAWPALSWRAQMELWKADLVTSVFDVDCSGTILEQTQVCTFVSWAPWPCKRAAAHCVKPLLAGGVHGTHHRVAPWAAALLSAGGGTLTSSCAGGAAAWGRRRSCRSCTLQGLPSAPPWTA